MASLAQQALDLANNTIAGWTNSPQNERTTILNLATAVQLLAQNALSATPSIDTTGSADATDVATTVPDTPPTS